MLIFHIWFSCLQLLLHFIEPCEWLKTCKMKNESFVFQTSAKYYLSREWRINFKGSYAVTIASHITTKDTNLLHVPAQKRINLFNFSKQKKICLELLNFNTFRGNWTIYDDAIFKDIISRRKKVFWWGFFRYHQPISNRAKFELEMAANNNKKEFIIGFKLFCTFGCWATAKITSFWHSSQFSCSGKYQPTRWVALKRTKRDCVTGPLRRASEKSFLKYGKIHK